jgi:hypothetical protein
MMRLKQRVKVIERRLERENSQASTSPVMWVLLSVIGFHRGGWSAGSERHVLTHGADVLGIKPDSDPADIEIQFDLMLRDLGIDGAPTTEVLETMQRLLDAVPIEARDADVAWWPTSPIEMWT